MARAVQDEDLSPLGALVQSRKQLLQHRGRDFHHVPSRRFGYLAEGGDAVGDHGGVGIRDQVVEGLDEAPLLDEVGGDVVELGHAHGRRLPDVLQRGGDRKEG